MEEEIWKDIIGYEGLYQVSSYGRVKSLERYAFVSTKNNCYQKIHEKILKPATNGGGYKYVRLSNKNIKKNKVVHVAVAESFLNHIPNKFVIVVDHIDGDRLNNFVCNLQLIPNRQNILKSIYKKQKSSQYPGVCWHKQYNKWQAAIRIDGKSKYLGRFDSELEASEAYQKAKNLIENI